MRPYPLADQVDGINLRRSKGGASPKSLFDLVNGWVTPKGTINARAGSATELYFPAGTKGELVFEGKHHTFSAAAVTGAVDSRVQVHVLRHPTSTTATLAKIHNAFVILGRIYAVAEFSDGLVRHYYLDQETKWTANTILGYGVRRVPTIDKGLYFKITNTSAIPPWQANTVVAVNDERQPRVANNYKYKLTAATGTAPYRTSNTEPTWPTVDGATVKERRYITDSQTDPGDSTPPEPPPVNPTPSSEYGPYPPSGGDWPVTQDF